ncbi:DsbA family oxidoreductase [Asticcacaulis sp. AND118]|uniref:DsbA family oxidoreductase n=1 Tax=Asticcacaulis sp. AND118 TaxID=2840468 RepID=UPI001CFFE2F9|nr:DsbA family oxidoreductase [Asticcacaulis sp. AND118]UDF03176.1 DsbA family oxidoreductase [Asticcacaulis sp. AND118]
MSVSPSPITVDIWSDLICPFCWIGKRHFEAALEGFEGKHQVTVRHHAFRLGPDAPVAPVGQMLQQKYGLTPDQAQQNQSRVEQMAAAAGLNMKLDGTLYGDTLKAHRLVKFAQDKGLAAEAVERLYRAYFAETQSLFDEASLGALAVEIGLDRAEVEAFLKTDRYADTVLEEQEFITARGVQGVPFFVVNDRYAVSGAQPVEGFTQVLNRAWDDLPTEVKAGPTCDDGVCR